MVLSMASLPEAHLRILYSLLKPAVRCAARFHVPIRTAVDLLRLAYFEVLHQQGLSFAEIGERLGQTDRHMRSLAQRLQSDFFSAEVEVGLVREMEGLLATKPMSEAALREALSAYGELDVTRALTALLAEDRIRSEDGVLKASNRYTVLRTDVFHRRIDALNHCLEATYGAIVHRLLLDDTETAAVKTITFVANAEALRKFMKRLEGELRTEIASLEERATFENDSETRFSLGLTLTPVEGDKGGPGDR
jgi:hypothetical protein